MPSKAPPTAHALTDLLYQWREGSGSAFASLIDQVYARLHSMAAIRVNQAGRSVTLSPTELLHEVLIDAMPAPMDWQNRAHFYATMSPVIRSTLVDHALARAANKRGGDPIRVTLTGADVGEESMAFDLLVIDQALSRLEAEDARCGQVMHLTYFGGLSQEEIANVLHISVASVTRGLRFARAALAKALIDER